ncbi:MAG: EAL domain-containing protein [Pseudomonadales bacterium]|nr:EAL domain-containing protein [Pseudomonadales bacterium]
MTVVPGLLSKTLNFMGEGIILIDVRTNKVVECNPAAHALFLASLKPGDIVNWKLLLQDNQGLIEEAIAVMLERSESIPSKPLQVTSSSGAQLSMRIVKIADQNKILVMVLVKPVSSEQGSMQRLNQIYSVLSETNKVVANSQTRTDLFESICRIAVAEGGFPMAWMGISHGQQIIPLAHFGDDQGYLKEIKINVDEPLCATDPAVKAFRENKICFVNDTTAELGDAFWRLAACERQYRALAALPIRLADNPIGVFVLYSNERDYFDNALLELLQDMANDIQLGLHWIDQETKRVEIEGKFRRLFQAIEQSATAVTITDASGVIEYVNPHFCYLTGYTPGEVVGLSPEEMASQEDSGLSYGEIKKTLLEGKEWRGELCNRAKDGNEFWTIQHIAPIRGETGTITHFVSTASDITELHHAQETIEKLAYYDELTGLPNRRMFFDRLNQIILTAQRTQEIFAVCFLDLDGFKNINDSLGHEAGDQLLVEVAKRLKTKVRAKDSVCRLGGDEFTIILTDINSPRDASIVSRNIISALAKPIDLGDTRVIVTTSIGIAVYPNDGGQLDDLTRHADLAMYHAKASGRNNYQYFTEEMNHKIQARMALEQRLRKAIENQELIMRYQPVIDAVDGAIIAVEAIPEWYENGKLVPVETFVPLAEETGLSADIGHWVVEQACHDCIRLKAQCMLDIKVSVNIWSHQFRNPNQLLAQLDALIEHTKLPAKYIQLEINESILSEDVRASIETLRQIRSRGIGLAVDNFGMGYSSLRYLKRFPVDIIKIDRAFVRDVAVDENDAAITSAIIALAHQLNFKVLAVGVETRKHLQFLERYWCDYLQGNYFSMPIGIDECIQYINKSVEHIG